MFCKRVVRYSLFKLSHIHYILHRIFVHYVYLSNNFSNVGKDKGYANCENSYKIRKILKLEVTVMSSTSFVR